MRAGEVGGLGRIAAGGAAAHAAVGRALHRAPGPRRRKILTTNSGSSLWVCTHDAAGRGFVAQRLERNNVLTGSGDLGGVQETWRRTFVWIIREAVVANTAPVNVVGAWTAANLNSTNNPWGYQSDAVLRSIPSRHSTTAGDYLEFLTALDGQGRFTVLLQDRTGLDAIGQAAGAQNVVISDAGGMQIATFAADAGQAGLRQVVLQHPEKSNQMFVCRITRGSGGGRLTVVGTNSVLLTRPQDPASELSTYTFDVFLRSTAATPFVNHDGAQDYAFRDFLAQRTGGSVHGGEMQTALAAFADRRPYTLPQRGVCSEFSLHQSSVIDYTPFGGGVIVVDAVLDFSIDGRPRQSFRARGDAIMSTAYLGMSTVWDAFKMAVAPVVVLDGSSRTGNGDTVDDYVQGKTPQVRLRDPLTGNEVLTETSAAKTYPGFERVVLHWEPGRYFKRWNFGIKDINRPLGVANWTTADAYLIA